MEAIRFNSFLTTRYTRKTVNEETGLLVDNSPEQWEEAIRLHADEKLRRRIPETQDMMWRKNIA